MLAVSNVARLGWQGQILNRLSSKSTRWGHSASSASLSDAKFLKFIANAYRVSSEAKHHRGLFACSLRMWSIHLKCNWYPKIPGCSRKWWSNQNNLLISLRHFGGQMHLLWRQRLLEEISIRIKWFLASFTSIKGSSPLSHSLPQIITAANFQSLYLSSSFKIIK